MIYIYRGAITCEHPINHLIPFLHDCFGSSFHYSHCGWCHTMFRYPFSSFNFQYDDECVCNNRFARASVCTCSNVCCMQVCIVDVSLIYFASHLYLLLFIPVIIHSCVVVFFFLILRETNGLRLSDLCLTVG